MLEEKKHFVHRLSTGHQYKILKNVPAIGESRGPFTWEEAKSERDALNAFIIKRPKKRFVRAYTDREMLVLDYLSSMGKALNRSGLETELGIPFRSIRDWMNGIQPLTHLHLERIETWIEERIL